MQWNWKRVIVASAVAGVVLAVASLSPRRLLADVKAAMVQDADQPARQPFQAMVAVNLNTPGIQYLSIPAGKRLVVDFIETHGTADGTNHHLQPYIELSSSVGTYSTVQYLIAPQLSPTAPLRYQLSTPMTIYSDNLGVAKAYAGDFVSDFAFEVNISGHLITP